MPDADVAERLSVVLARRTDGWRLPPQEGDALPPADFGLFSGPDVDEESQEEWRRPSRRVRDADAVDDDDRVVETGSTGLLPRSLRTGRLDPGRRGAVALVVVALFSAVVAGGVVLRGRPQEVAVPPAVVAVRTPPPGVAASPPGAEVVVSVSGKVRTPGLVRLPLGSRVDDALRAAGGPLPGVPTDLINLARKLVDGEQLLVGIDPPPGAAAGAAGAGSKPGLLDLNAAAVGDFDALPGIGPVLAQRIVDWRTEHDRFDSVEQLREVTGIGEAKFADLAPKVTV